MAVWRYLGVFSMDKAGPKFRAWQAMTAEETAERQRVGLTALIFDDVLVGRWGRRSASTIRARSPTGSIC